MPPDFGCLDWVLLSVISVEKKWVCRADRFLKCAIHYKDFGKDDLVDGVYVDVMRGGSVDERTVHCIGKASCLMVW